MLTARSAAAEDLYISTLLTTILRLKGPKLLGLKESPKQVESNLYLGSDVNKVIFYDDSHNNIKDVAVSGRS